MTMNDWDNVDWTMTVDEVHSTNGDNDSIDRMYWDLKKYMELLPHTVGSLNALLDAEHNSLDSKARGLLRYYQERPNLLEYTLEKELPRMDYTWIDEMTGEFISDKARISLLLWEASLSMDPVKVILPRCANQSLLADLLQFLTLETENALIRTQFHMAVHTLQVNITIMPSNGTVLVKASLSLSLPHPLHGLVKIATVNVSAQFSPLTPLFHYHVESVQLEQPGPEDEELREMASFLIDLPSFWIEEDEPLGSQQQHSKLDKWRDVFLTRTQSAWKQSSGLAQKILKKVAAARHLERGLESDEHDPALETEKMHPSMPQIQFPKSFRRLKEAQSASSKRIINRIKMLSPSAGFTRKTSPSQEKSATSPSQEKSPSAWEQVSARLKNKTPTGASTEKWTGVLRSKWDRLSNSYRPSFKGDENSGECWVFSIGDAPTDPPSDDEERVPPLFDSVSPSSPSEEQEVDLLDRNFSSLTGSNIWDQPETISITLEEENPFLEATATSKTTLAPLPKIYTGALRTTQVAVTSLKTAVSVPLRPPQLSPSEASTGSLKEKNDLARWRDPRRLLNKLMN